MLEGGRPEVGFEAKVGIHQVPEKAKSIPNRGESILKVI